MKGKFSFSIKYTLEIINAEVHYHLIILFPNGSQLFIDDHNILFADWDEACLRPSRGPICAPKPCTARIFIFLLQRNSTHAGKIGGKDAMEATYPRRTDGRTPRAQASLVRSFLPEV
jgi:hypothetical protein